MNPDTRSLRTASLIAGLALALIVVLAPLGNFLAVQPLITPGDAAKTAQDILNSEALFRLGDPTQAMRAIDAYNTIWLVGLIFFGIHLVLIGYLAYRSGYMAKVFGILLVIAGIGYLVDGFGTVLVPNYSINIAQFTFVGEAALMFWLLIKGTRKDFSNGESDKGHHFDPDSLPGGRQSAPSAVGEPR